MALFRRNKLKKRPDCPRCAGKGQVLTPEIRTDSKGRQHTHWAPYICDMCKGWGKI
jgi:DnaJ-class molecular chaperone